MNGKSSGKSSAVVGFIGNLAPLYEHTRINSIGCAQSLRDGTLIYAIDETDFGEEQGRVRVLWQGDSRRSAEVDGPMFATLALERYVRLHGLGASEEELSFELWFMARHFYFKTGCSAFLPQLREPPTGLVRFGRQAKRIGEGILISILTGVPRLG